MRERSKDQERESSQVLKVLESLQKLSLAQISQSLGVLLSEFGLNPAEDFFRYHFDSTENFCFLVRARVFNYDTGEARSHIAQVSKSLIQNTQFSDARIIALIIYRLEAAALLRESMSLDLSARKEKPVETITFRARRPEPQPAPVVSKSPTSPPLTHTAVRQALPTEDDNDLSAYGIE